MAGYILALDGRGLSVDRVGEKAAGLNRLRRDGVRVPDGFVITTGALRAAIAQAGLNLNHPGAEARQRLASIALPGEVERAIRNAYDQLGGPVAVRSSMIGEDAATASFAGQLDTFLNVSGAEAVLDAVRACWASILNERALGYARDAHAPVTPRLAGVIVQRMVAAASAGVAFSADPLTGENHVIIEAVAGLGDTLVQGRASPDRWVVARGVIVERALQNEATPALRDADALSLARLTQDIAARADAPQDVEWAWDGADFHALQSRPITSLAGKDLYSNRFVSEIVPGLSKPLVWSTNTSAIARNVFGRIFDELLGPGALDPGDLVRRVHGRVYANMTLLGTFLERVGLPRNFLDMITRGDGAGARRAFLSPRHLGARLRLVGFALRHARAAPEIEAFAAERRVAFRAFESTPWRTLSPEALRTTLDQLARLHADTQWRIFITAVNMSVRSRILTRLIQRANADLVAGDLLRGAGGAKSLEPNRQLLALADQARALPAEFKRALLTTSDADLRAALGALPAGAGLAEAVMAFVERFGYLSANGTDFSLPTWRENPAQVWRAIGRLCAQAATVATAPPPDADALRQQVRTALTPMRRRIFDSLLGSTARFVDLREQVSALLSEGAYFARRGFLALADILVARGALAGSDDIFYLTRTEVDACCAGALAPAAARALVLARRVEMEADALVDPPETLRGDLRLTHAKAMAPQAVLKGVGGSAGVLDGIARVVIDPEHAPIDLSRRDILVVPFTDIGWTPLLANVGGIVSETGGQLSHAAIVAREYGLPAVVGVRSATRAIRDGQPITIDGGLGLVYLDGAPSPSDPVAEAN